MVGTIVEWADTASVSTEAMDAVGHVFKRLTGLQAHEGLNRVRFLAVQGADWTGEVHEPQ